jgi:hypothetical protein
VAEAIGEKSGALDHKISYLTGHAFQTYWTALVESVRARPPEEWPNTSLRIEFEHVMTAYDELKAWAFSARDNGVVDHEDAQEMLFHFMLRLKSVYLRTLLVKNLKRLGGSPSAVKRHRS